MAGYKWILGGKDACEACRNLAKDIHPEKPERPHPKCRCTIVAVFDDSKEDKCVNDDTIIQRAELLGHDFEAENRQLKALYHEWQFTAICRDNSVVEVTVNIEISGSELEEVNTLLRDGGSNAESLAMAKSLELALHEAMDEIESVCPKCGSDKNES
jgi:hypothetical protein